MPIFPDHNLLFVHIPKNAGRSVEAALLGASGSPDGGRRGAVSRAATFLQRKTASAFARKHLIGTLDYSFASQHMTYVEMEMLGLLPVKDHVHSFAIVRNPYDRALSSVMHFANSPWVDEPDISVRKDLFLQALTKWLDRSLLDHNDRAHRRTQLSYLRDQTGLIAVDTLLRFESIATDFSEFLDARGISDVTLPFRGDAGRRRSYRDYYNRDARDLVEHHFGEDIAAFDYAF